MTTASPSTPLAYLVSAYPAVSHTFIQRELAALRALGHRIVVASVNRPDRPEAQMDDAEREEARTTYTLKQHGVAGALAALAYWMLRHPLALLRTLQAGRPLASGGKAWWSGLAYAVEAAMVARWMRQQGAQHLHVHFGNAGASVGVLVKQLTGCHLSYTIHGPDEFDEVGGQHLATKMHAADAIVCISQFARAQLMRIAGPSNWDKLRVCRLGVQAEAFPFALRTSTGRARLLCVGRLTPAKGQVLLVRAIAQLRDMGVDCQLTLVGAGPDRERIEREIAERNLEDRVSLTGALTQDQVRQQLAAADVFVLPSLAEGIPVVLMEAMSCGVPCVSTPVNGIPELIQHGRTGLLATPGDVDSLTLQLGRLIEQPALGKSLALAAREKVREDFDLRRNVAALSQLFAAFPRAA